MHDYLTLYHQCRWTLVFLLLKKSPALSRAASPKQLLFMKDQLQRCNAALLVANSDRLSDFVKEDLPIADLAGPGIAYDRVNRRIHQVVCQNHFNFDLRQKIDGVLSPSIRFTMPLLAAMAAYIRNRHALDSQLHQGILHRLESGRLNNRFNLCHHIYPLCSVIRSERLPRRFMIRLPRVRTTG